MSITAEQMEEDMNPYLASAITGTCYLWKIKGDR